MQHLKLLFLFGFFGFDFTGKYARRGTFELLDPPVDLRLMNAKFTTQFSNGLLAERWPPCSDRKQRFLSLSFSSLGCLY